MFGSNNSNSHGKFKSAMIDTLIGQNTEVEGNVVFKGGLHLDGTVRGNVMAEEESGSTLVLSEQGCIEGEVRVPNMLLNGKVEGDVYASERVELAKHARISGNVYYNLLEMAMGAEINGNMVHRKQGEKKLLEHQKPQHKESEAAGDKQSSGKPISSA